MRPDGNALVLGASLALLGCSAHRAGPVTTLPPSPTTEPPAASTAAPPSGSEPAAAATDGGADAAEPSTELATAPGEPAPAEPQDALAAAVRRTIQRNISQLSRCFEEAIARGETLGPASGRGVRTPGGWYVIERVGSTGDASIDACVDRVLARLVIAESEVSPAPPRPRAPTPIVGRHE